jgi:hypothetical protein
MADTKKGKRKPIDVPIFGIDTDVIIHAGLATQKPGKVDLDKRKRSLALLRWGQARQMVFPTVALSEVLIPIPKDKRSEVIHKLKEAFVIHPFDERAATIASDLWVRHKQLPEVEQYNERLVLKADILIIACAVAAGATEFYSHDDKCRKLANLIIKGCQPPSRDPDGNLFESIENDEASS